MPGGLFVQPWWLDAVAPGSWEEATVERDGVVIARLPFCVKKTRVGLVSHMPALTQSLGPWVDLGRGGPLKRESRYKQLSTELIAKLPRFASFSQVFSPEIDNWLPWYWAGYKQTTRYTYVLNDLSSTESLWRNLAPKVRSEIKKARASLEVRSPGTLGDFLTLMDKTFERQGRINPVPRAVIERLDAACAARQQCRLFLACDHEGRAHAGSYLVWDDQSAYYLMGGGDPSLRTSGASSLCIWAAIEHAAKVTRIFNFEGSMIPSIESFFRSFGGVRVPLSKVSKDSWKWQIKKGGRLASRLLLAKGRRRART